MRTTTPPTNRASVINGGSGSVARNPRRAGGGGKITIYMREHAPENQVTKTAFKRLPNLEKTCIIMVWDVLEQKRDDHAYTAEVRSRSGPESLHPGQSIRKRNMLILYSAFAIVGDR